MGIIALACYRPKIGKEKELNRLMRNHLKVLRKQNLVTGRDSIMMKAADGTIIEVFEWKSKTMLDKAHKNPAVLKMWSEYSKVCDYVPLRTLPETADLFAGFSPFK